MASIVVAGDTSGTVTLAAPAVSGTTTLTLPASTGNLVTDTATQTLTNKTLTSPTITGATITVASTAAPAFSAYWGGADQNISSSTFTKVTLSSELFDTNNNFDSTTNYRFTPTVAGYYQINAGIRIIGVNASNKILAIYKNGAGLYSMDSFTASTVSFNGSFTPVSISTTIYLNGSTDYIELYGYSNGSSTAFAGGLGGVNTAPWNTFMTGFLARSA